MSDRKKVLHVCNWVGLRGSEKTVLNSARTLTEYDHVFLTKELLSQEAVADFMAVGEIIVEESLAHGGMFNYPSLDNDFIKRRSLDLVVVYLPGDDLPPYIKSLDCKKILYVLCTKQCFFDDRYFDEVIVLSEHASTLNPHLKPVWVYPTVERLDPVSSKAEVINRYFPRVDANNTFLVSRIGSIEVVKHVEDSLKVAKSFSHVDNMMFLVAGLGNPGYVNQLFQKYSGPNIAYAGCISEQEKADINAASDVCLYPTEFESFGYSLAEPMAYGVPVLTYNESASPETVGEGGIAVEFNNVSALAQELASLITRPFLRQELGARARDRWESHFAPGLYAERVSEISFD